MRASGYPPMPAVIVDRRGIRATLQRAKPPKTHAWSYKPTENACDVGRMLELGVNMEWLVQAVDGKQ